MPVSHVLTHLENRPGIYIITNRITQERYVGQSVNVRQRCKTHRSMLSSPDNAEIYANPNLIASAKIYGFESFEFGVLEYLDCPPRPSRYDPHDNHWVIDVQRELKKREAYYIQTLRPEYNNKAEIVDGVGCGAILERHVVEAIAKSGMRQTDFIRMAVLEKLRAMSLLEQ